MRNLHGTRSFCHSVRTDESRAHKSIALNIGKFFPVVGSRLRLEGPWRGLGEGRKPTVNTGWLKFELIGTRLHKGRVMRIYTSVVKHHLYL